MIICILIAIWWLSGYISTPMFLVFIICLLLGSCV